MAITSTPEDPLVALLRQQRQMFELGHRDLPPEERERLWENRVNHLNAALTQGSSLHNNAVSHYDLTPARALDSSSMTRTKTVPSTVRRKSFNAPIALQNVSGGGVSMARKRSSNDRVAAERASMPNAHFALSRRHCDSYDNGTAPKAQRTLTGRKAVPRIQTAPNLTSSLSSRRLATRPSGSSPVGTSPDPLAPPPFTSPLLSSNSESFAASYDSMSSHRNMPASGMSRNDSLTGSFYKSMTNMKLASPADDHRQRFRLQPSNPGSMDFSHEDTFPLHEEMGPSSAPIPIPRRRGGSMHSKGSSGSVRIPPRHSEAEEQQSPSPKMQGRRQLPNRPIAPRPTADSGTSSLSSSAEKAPKIIRMFDADGKAIDKYQISKVSRSKKEKEKQHFCDRCNKHPQGFRGPHELQRHFDAQHAVIKKAWICVDGSPNKDKLTGCKWCAEKKTYPAYYNAAAHIRRIHFKPKAESGEKSKPRGGFSGGKYPPMDTLKKYWMRQVELKNGQIIEPAEEPDLDVVDEDELELDDQELFTSRVERATSAPDKVGSVSVIPIKTTLTGQARLGAELAEPRLSTTVETAASSFVDSVSGEAGFDSFGLESMMASGLLGAAPSDSQSSNDDLHQSFYTVDISASLDASLSVRPSDFEFADIFPDLELSLPQMPFDDGEF